MIGDPEKIIKKKMRGLTDGLGRDIGKHNSNFLLTTQSK